MLHATDGCRVTLTGATGFIGRRLLAHVAEHARATASNTPRGASNIAALRVHRRRPLPTDLAVTELAVTELAADGTQSSAMASTTVPVSQCGGDLQQTETWQTLLRDTDVVVHAAGAVRGRNAADFAINHLAVAALLRAVETLPRPPRILLISSLAARSPALSDYAASKRQGELNLLAYPKLPACILRPPAIYGPGDVEMLPLMRIMARGLGVYPGDLDARVSLLHVDDLCRLILAWIRAPVFGSTLEPDDGTPGGYRWRDLHDTVAAVMGRRVRPLRLAPALLRAVASALALVAKLPGNTQAPMLSHGKVRELTAPEWVCSPMQGQVTGWSPRISLHNGLARLLLHDSDQSIRA